jgi:CRP-like cAMP-binding protein
MDETIIRFITQYVPLSEVEISIIKEQNLFKSFPKNYLLLSEGEQATECYFVMKGCIRAYQLIDGEERNTDFYFENQPIRPISYQTNQPSQYFLACLEDTVVAVGSDSRNQTLVERIPQLSSLINKMNEEQLIQKTEEFDHFKNHSPEERYLRLLEEKPALLARIPLYHLASYLGITQISLSRIRSRISTK